jgi:hypothetical protein
MTLFPQACAVAALALVWAAPAAPQSERGGDVGDCTISLARLPSSTPLYRDFPAAGDFRGKPAALDLASNRDARQFRTVLTAGAAKGPNFAGHFTVVGWGCGSACLAWAIVDATSGKVYFDKIARVVSAANVGENPVEPGVNGDFDVLRFRRDSDLLVMLGAPGEDEQRDGVNFYRWDGSALQLLDFFPRYELCAH